MPDARVEFLVAQFRELMGEAFVNNGLAFVLVVSETTADGGASYVSNVAQRAQLAAMLREAADNIDAGKDNDSLLLKGDVAGSA